MQAARDLECEEDGARWDEPLKKVAEQKPAPNYGDTCNNPNPASTRDYGDTCNTPLFLPRIASLRAWPKPRADI